MVFIPRLGYGTCTKKCFVLLFFIPAVGVRGIFKLIQSETRVGTADRSGAGSSWPTGE